VLSRRKRRKRRKRWWRRMKHSQRQHRRQARVPETAGRCAPKSLHKVPPALKQVSFSAEMPLSVSLERNETVYHSRQKEIPPHQEQLSFFSGKCLGGRKKRKRRKRRKRRKLKQLSFPSGKRLGRRKMRKRTKRRKRRKKGRRRRRKRRKLKPSCQGCHGVVYVWNFCCAC
jgi:hypothetical protein